MHAIRSTFNRSSVWRPLLEGKQVRVGAGCRLVSTGDNQKIAVEDNVDTKFNFNLGWRAEEDDPRNHTSAHESLFYMLPDEKHLQKIFGHKSPYDIETTRFYKVIGMMPLMIRRPYLEFVDYLNKINPNTPNVRMLFYGDKGHGKTHTLAHLIHYLHLKQDHIIIHVREMKKFTRSPWDIAPSTWHKGRVDTPLNAALLLQQFKIQNADLMESLKDTLKCSQDYEWSSREKTIAGEPLMNVIDHGIDRVIHASDCVSVLFNELMRAADMGEIKLATILDNVRFLFLREAGVLKHPDRKAVLVDEITVARAIKKLIKGTYKNGIVISTCDDKLSKNQNQTPQETLGYEGWQHFDPFLPIHVPKYSRKEYENCMNFYEDIDWITRPQVRTKEGRDEVRFISGLNPGQVYDICRSL